MAGVGTLLLTPLELDAQSHGAARMILSTGGPQTAAISFYRTSGYADIAAFGRYLDSADAVHLGKVLGLGPAQSMS